MMNKQLLFVTLSVVICECKASCDLWPAVACVDGMFEGIHARNFEFMCRENGVKKAATCVEKVLQNCTGLDPKLIEGLSPGPKSAFDEACNMTIVPDNSTDCQNVRTDGQFYNCVTNGPNAEFKKETQNTTSDHVDEILKAVCRFWDGVDGCRNKRCGEDVYNFMTKIFKPFHPTTCGSSRTFSMSFAYLVAAVLFFKIF